MMTRINDGQDDPAIELLRASAITDRDLGDGTTRALVTALAREVTRTEPRPQRSRRRVRRRYALVAAALASSLVLSAFAYGPLTSRTGWFGDPAQTETDGSEWLRTDAADFGEVITRLVPPVPLPEGATWDAEIENLVEHGRAEPALRQEVAVRAGFAFYAQCSWLVAWANAHERGDTTAMAAAQQVLAAAPDWPEFARIDGGGVRDSLRTQAEAAARNDREMLQPWLEACAGFPVEAVR